MSSDTPIYNTVGARSREQSSRHELQLDVKYVNSCVQTCNPTALDPDENPLHGNYLRKGTQASISATLTRKGLVLSAKRASCEPLWPIIYPYVTLHGAMLWHTCSVVAPVTILSSRYRQVIASLRRAVHLRLKLVDSFCGLHSPLDRPNQHGIHCLRVEIVP